ncbi:helix-turn-helix transcriptional regulator [Flavobacterium sp. ANB]|uniref:helix-turn-helix domain-containing protein n=1 Tax=unclassified Flavobacterium TaxID=196869 RepID=UPI0012B6B5DD|nr:MULTISPECIES: AraC family transcriptional regulator [unclassified Flavobacterium]MBF4515763.1 helix-turn-helix transcriptional regulator [Flavobacterium sp. ANB]MTD68766.1 helix-turn-helix domain-containing protein [Flavobacterium sp. LC2016-13]
MIYKGTSHEYLFLTDINPENKDLIFGAKDTELTLIWNTGSEMNITVDKVKYCLSQNDIIFLTEFHQIDSIEVEMAKMLRFNQNFYCIINNDNEVGSKGLLFYGAMGIPVVSIPENYLESMKTSWDILLTEMDAKDNLQIDMLQSMLKRILILCARSLMSTTDYIKLENNQADIIREFNYLVESHFAKHHDVAFYASKLNKSPKTLSNLFAVVSERPPLSIIHDRIMIHARKQIRYTQLSIKEIAYDLGYEDLQSFSRFFKNKEGISPAQFREKAS